MIRNIAICTFFLIMLGMAQSYAQQVTNSTGGVVTGTGGTVSDAIGLTGYTSLAGTGGTALEGVISSGNIAPVLTTIGPKSVDEQTALTFVVVGTDADQQALTYSLDVTSVSKDMSIDATTGAFSWTPTESQDGIHNVTVTVSDGQASDMESITITVVEINIAPSLAAIGAKSVDELLTLAFTVSATDADLPAQTLTYSLDQPSQDEGMTLDATTGAFSWTPDESQDGLYDAVFTVSDGVAEVSETVAITVNDIPDDPVAIEPSANEISATTFKAAWGAVNGAEEYELEVSANDFVNLLPGYNPFVVTTTQAEVTGLQANTTYQFRVRAKSSLGISGNSNVINVTTLEDVSSAPLAINSVNYSSRQERGASQTVGISVNGGTAPYSVLFSHKGLLETTFTTQTLTATTAGNYSFEITSALLDELGVTFEVEVTDAADNADTETGTIHLAVNEAQSPPIPFEKFGGTDESWNLFSIPYDLDNKSISALFADYDPTRYEYDWKIMRYRNSSNDYVNFNTGQVKTGEAYWFNAKDQISVKTGAGQTVSQIPFNLTLLTGWNLIGNPYPVGISWNSVINSNGEDGNVDPILVFVPGTRNFSQGDVIQPFSGGFVWAEAGANLSISPIDNGIGSRIKNREITNRNLDEPEWMLPIQLTSNRNAFQQIAVGMHPEASEDKDIYDKMTLPRFFDYLEMFATHEEYFYPWFSEDITATEEEHSWRFTMESDETRDKVQLSWDQQAIQDNLSTLMLVDEQEGRVIDMKQTGTYELAFSGKRSFTVYYSLDPTKSVLPSTIFLGDAYPNPANQSTIIPVTLPDTKEKYTINLDIYNMQGQKVQALIKGSYEPGFYEFSWEVNKESPAGIYLYRLSFEDQGIDPVQKRVIIQR